MDYSVVIPAYNGTRTIHACLRAVERALSGLAGEVIVVDSSSDATASLVRDHFPGVRLIRSETRLSAGEARNRGSAAARGRLVLFTDQDCVVPPDWIPRLEAHFSDPAVAGVGGSVAIHNPASASGCALYFLEFLHHFPSNGGVRTNRGYLVGCNSAYRAEVLGEVQFPNRTLGEDVLFGHALRSQQLRTLYDPTIEVAHDNRSGWRTFFAYNRQIGRAAASYHWVVGRRWATAFLRFPGLTYIAPAAVLPTIAAKLARSRPGYLLRFLALLPMCFLGNMAWAAGFHSEVQHLKRRERHVIPAGSADTQPGQQPADGRAQAPRPRAS